MRKTFWVCLMVFLASLPLAANSPAPVTVPNEMTLFGVKVKITRDAKEEISKTLDLLVRSQYHFQKLVDRSVLFMPYVEEILKQEGIPDDFKYLPIQESQFVSDTVSASNAVGFWQFKKASAQELGVRVDNIVDERKHIISATVGATKYFKRSNFVFDNWVLSLQSYLQGLTGTQRSVSENLYGVKSMTIGKKSHWYIKKFIAHKLAFQGYVGKDRRHPELQLNNHEGKGKTLKQVSQELRVDYNALKRYNKWLNQSRIPGDKSYKVFYVEGKGKKPVAYKQPESEGKPSNKTSKPLTKPTSKPKTNSKSNTRKASSSKKANRFKPIEGNTGIFPRISGNTRNAYEPYQIRLNGIPAIKAKSGETLQSLASRTGVKVSKLRKFNDIGVRGNVRADRYYYLKKKATKGDVHYHIVKSGETLWGISQDYGIRLNKLLQKNRMRATEELKIGRVLWMRFIRPKDIPVEFVNIPTSKSNSGTKSTSVRIDKTVKQKVDKPKVKDIPEKEEPEVFQPPRTKKELRAGRRDTIVSHFVKPKETFFAIARTYEVDIDDVLDWNGLSVTDGLEIGQEIKLVVKKSMFAPKEPELQYHTVEAGETLWAISKKYGVKVEDLKKWNKKSTNELSLGERLKIYK